MVFLYQQACVRQPAFFGVTDGVEKVTLRPFPVVWPPLKWSTVRGFILTQADKFALRKYLSRLKLVFASDTGSYTLYFLAGSNRWALFLSDNKSTQNEACKELAGTDPAYYIYVAKY